MRDLLTGVVRLKPVPTTAAQWTKEQPFVRPDRRWLRAWITRRELTTCLRQPSRVTRLAQRLIQCLDRSADRRDIARPGSGQHSIDEVACGSQQFSVEIGVGADPREIVRGPYSRFKAMSMI